MQSQQHCDVGDDDDVNQQQQLCQSHDDSRHQNNTQRQQRQQRKQPGNVDKFDGARLTKGMTKYIIQLASFGITHRNICLQLCVSRRFVSKIMVKYGMTKYGMTKYGLMVNYNYLVFTSILELYIRQQMAKDPGVCARVIRDRMLADGVFRKSKVPSKCTILRIMQNNIVSPAREI